MPVLLLGAVGFVVTAVCHLLAIAGKLESLSRAFAWTLMGVVLGCFVLAVLTHPKSEFRGGRGVGLWQCLEPMRPPARAAYLVLWVYSLVAMLASFPPHAERAGLPGVLEEPYFLTAFILAFATGGLAVSHSTLLLRRRSASAYGVGITSRPS